MAKDEGAQDPQPPPIPQPAIAPLEQLARQNAQQAVAQIHQFGLQIGPPPDALIAKFDPQHITTLLANAEADGQRKHSLKRQYFWGGIVIGGIGFLLLCWMFLSFDKTEMLEKVLALFAGLIGGFAGGFSVGRATKK